MKIIVTTWKDKYATESVRTVIDLDTLMMSASHGMTIRDGDGRIVNVELTRGSE